MGELFKGPKKNNECSNLEKSSLCERSCRDDNHVGGILDCGDGSEIKMYLLKFPILSPGSKISDPKKVNFEIFYLAASSNFSHVLRMLMMYVPGKMFNEF